MIQNALNRAPTTDSQSTYRRALNVLAMLTALTVQGANATTPTPKSLDRPPKPPPLEPQRNTPLSLVDVSRYKGGLLYSVRAPFPCSGIILSSTDARSLFVLPADTRIMRDDTRIMRVDLNSLTTSWIDLGATVRSAEHQVKRVSADGRFVILRDGTFIDTHAEDLSESKPLPGASPLNSWPYFLSEIFGNFLPHTHHFLAHQRTTSRGEVWAVIDLEKAAILEKISIDGTLRSISPDCRYAAFLDHSGAAVLKDVKQDHSILINPGFDDFTVTFRGNSAIAVGLNHGLPLVHSFYKIDLTQLSNGATEVGQLRQEQGEYPKWHDVVELPPKSGRLPKKDGKFILKQRDPTQEIFLPIGDTLAIGKLDNYLFDLEAGASFRIATQTELKGASIFAGNRLFNLFFAGQEDSINRRDPTGRIVPGVFLIRPWIHLLSDPSLDSRRETYGQIKSLITSRGTEDLLKAASILSTFTKLDAYTVLSEVEAWETARLKRLTLNENEIAEAIKSLASHIISERRTAFKKLHETLESRPKDEQAGLLEIIVSSSQNDPEARHLAQQLRAMIEKPLPTVLQRIKTLREMLDGL